MIRIHRALLLASPLLLGMPLVVANAQERRGMELGREFYVSIKATKQGTVKGESIRDKWKNKIAGLGFQFSAKVPVDAATGAVSGRHQYAPLTFTKEWGAATPQLFQAFTMHEPLSTVLFEFVRTNSEGIEEVYHTIELTNAIVSEIKYYTVGGATARESRDLEDVSLTFQKIKIDNKPGKTSAFDDGKK